jgi:hypothetical protein
MRAVLRMDGFVSADAGFEPGGFVTPPLLHAGKQLVLSVDTGGGGWLRVAFEDVAGQPLPGYALGDCDTVNGNWLRHVVSWHGNSNLSALAGQPIRMKVEMRSTKLYAFQFAP